MGFFTTVENQMQFIVPTTPITETIDYNDRFMISDSEVRPIVYEVSKIEDTFPCGATKVTLKQDHYNPSLDNPKLRICNYYTPIVPEESKKETFSLKYSGTTPTLRLDGSSRTITIDSEYDIDRVVWSYSFDNRNVSLADLIDDFTIDESAFSVSISAVKNFSNLGKVITITAKSKHHEDSISLEVKR